MKKIIVISLFVSAYFIMFTGGHILSKTDPELQKRSSFFMTYMQETFPDFAVTDGEYLFILPNGCFSCNKSTCHFLTLNPTVIKNKYNAILISQSTLDALPENILSIDNNFLIDKTNKLDHMALGIAGISILKIKDKQIVAYKSMNVKDFQNGPEKFFQPIQ